jgi:hypothetical protein
MKKRAVLALACLLMFAGVGSAFAAAPAQDPAVNESVASGIQQDVANAPAKKLQVLKEFQDELHRLNALREDRLNLKMQIVNKQDRILDLTIAAKEKGNKQALKDAAAVRKQIQAVKKEQKDLWTNLAGETKAFRQAVKDGNKAEAKAHIDNAISIFGKINVNLGKEAGLLDQIIAILR